MNCMKFNLAGFTLIELLVVIAIIGVLALIMIPGLLASQRRSYDTGARMCAKSLQTAEAISQVDHKTYLATASDAALLDSLMANLDSACRNRNIFYRDRSTASTLNFTYVFDIWDRRGATMITATPSNVENNAPGATAFSVTGAGGINFP